MPLVEYRTGVYAPDGYAETSSEYICDWPDCHNTADYQGLCEEHFFIREQEELDIHYNVIDEDSLLPNLCKCGFTEADDEKFGQHVRRENGGAA